MNEPWSRWRDDSLEFEVRVHTRAKQEEIAGFYRNQVRIRLRAAPVDGKANRCLIRFIAKAFDVPARQVKIIRGAHARRKTLRIVAPQQIPPDLASDLCFPPG